MSEATRHTRRPPIVWRLGVSIVCRFLTGALGWRVTSRPPATSVRPTHALVVVFNHTSAVDAFLVADQVWHRLRRWCQPLVKTELASAPLLGALLRRSGAIPVARSQEHGREAAYTAAVARLRSHRTVLVAPEATITHDGTLLPLRHGAARLALAADVDVLVVTHFGAQRGFSPVARFAERGVVVTLTMDVVRPEPDEDATSLTGRIAATMLDRLEELRATYPQADHQAPWWPPYAVPAAPTTVAREHLEQYRHSMAEAVAEARGRMARIAEEHYLEQRLTRARDRVARLTEDARERLDELAEEARERATGRNDESRPPPGS